MAAILLWLLAGAVAPEEWDVHGFLCLREAAIEAVLELNSEAVKNGKEDYSAEDQLAAELEATGQCVRVDGMHAWKVYDGHEIVRQGYAKRVVGFSATRSGPPTLYGLTNVEGNGA
jgi:hypothetical protein